MDLLDLPAIELARGIRERKLSSVEVTKAFLDRIQATESKIQAFVSLAPDQAIAQAQEVDRRIANGQVHSALAGVPIAIKDNLCTLDGTTSCASKMLANYQAPYESTVVERLRKAGLVVVGKTNMDEFAMGSSTENSAVHTTRNPWDLQRTPGGSSGGAAACVAALQVPLSLGSDTGGSIRQPASLCGVCGLKPTYGRVSRYGLVAFASSLDQIGPFANNCIDLAAIAQVISGYDPLDSTSIPTDVDDYLALSSQEPKKMRIGVISSLLASTGVDKDTQANVQRALATSVITAQR